MTRRHPWIRLATRWVGHRRWIRFGIRDRVARFVHDPDRASTEKFSVPFYGLRYVGDFVSFIDWSVFYFGAYSAAELDLLGRILTVRGGGCCLDVGANVGNHTLYLASRAPLIIAFEPDPSLAQELRFRVSENRLPNVEVAGFGLGSITADLPFFASPDHNRGTGTFVTGIHERTGQTAVVRPGDEVLAERGDPSIVLAKIDVEGFEPDVLRGLTRTLDRCRPVVFFEWSRRSVERAGANDPGILFPPGYSLFQFEPEVVWMWIFARAPFALRPWQGEAHLDVNLLAVPTEDVHRLQAALGTSAQLR